MTEAMQTMGMYMDFFIEFWMGALPLLVGMWYIKHVVID